jgi:hypothetical protein
MRKWFGKPPLQVALQIAEGKGMGGSVAWWYNWATLSVGEILVFQTSNFTML